MSATKPGMSACPSFPAATPALWTNPGVPESMTATMCWDRDLGHTVVAQRLKSEDPDRFKAAVF